LVDAERGVKRPWPPVSAAKAKQAPSPSQGRAREVEPAADRGAMPRIQKMGRYHVLRLLGEGGMGCVYEAYDPELDRKLAIKVLNPGVRTHGDETMIARTRARLIREAKSLAKLAHPNVVPIFDVGLIDDKSVFLAMEFVPGMTLGDWLLRHRPSWREALEIVLQAGEGLAAAHAAGLLHRDIKPANIIVGLDGSVRVLDFGLAKADSEHSAAADDAAHDDVLPAVGESTLEGDSHGDGSEITQAGTLLGTPAYLPPEILRGARFDAQADLFAFGCVLFESLTLAKPFPVDSLRERELAISNSQLKWPPTVPKWLRKIVARTLAFAPQERGNGVLALLKAIRRGLRLEQRRALAGKGLAFVGLALIALGLGHTFWPSGEIEDPDCGDPQVIVDALLRREALDAAKAGFAASSSGLADELWVRAEKGLQDWREKWIDARRNLCPAVQEERGELLFRPGEREQARACLDEAKSEVATLLQIWAKPTFKQVMESGSALGSLSAPESCANAKALRERRPLPNDPEKRAWVLEQQGKLKGIGMRIKMADFEGAERELAGVKIPVEVPENLGLLAEWKGVAGFLKYSSAGHTNSASHGLQTAYLWRLSADVPVAMSYNSGNLWFVRAYRAHLLEESEELLGFQRAAVLRAGSPASAESHYERNLAISEGMRGNFWQSEKHVLRAIEILRQEPDINQIALAGLLGDLALTYQYAGDFHKSRQVQEQSTALMRGLFPKGHPDLSFSMFQLAQSNGATGRPFESLEILTTTASECEEANMPFELCTPPYTGLPDAAATLGLVNPASMHFRLLIDFEKGIGRRTSPIGPWSISNVAATLVMRGDTQGAAETARLGLVLIEAEGNVPPIAIAKTLFNSIRVALFRGELSQAQALLDRVRPIVETPSEESHDLALAYQFFIAELARQKRQTDQALNESEHGLLLSFAANLPPQSICWNLLDFANALLTANHPELAHHYATEAFALFSTIEGMQPHMRVPYHEALASIALAQARYGDALAELEQAYLVFDPVEVLDNRLAALHFIEAKVWWALADSASTRRHAIDLATQALREYEDWDGGAATYIHDVKQWLKHHRKPAS
jgi:tetratricopeptide (TPR) repeat protein